MIEWLTTKEMAERTGIEAHLFKPLREEGLLTGRKQGHGYRWDTEEMDVFSRATRGMDISSESRIRFYAAIIKMKMASVMGVTNAEGLVANQPQSNTWR